MSDLRERLDRELGRVLPARDARAAVDRRAGRRRRHRTVLLPVVTLILTAGLVAGLTYAFSPDSKRPPADDQAVTMPGEPVEVMVDGGLLWVLTTEPGCDGPVCDGFVVKVDAARGQVIDQVPVTSPNGIASGAGSIWVVSFADDTLLRIEPATESVQATIPLRLPFAVGNDGDRSFLPVDVDANDDAVWVSSGRGALAHVDPATNDIVDLVSRRSHTGGPLAIGQEGVWVADSLNGAVLVDPATHRVVDAVTLDDEAGQRFSVNSLVTRGGSVWAVGNWAHPTEELGGAGYVSGEGHAVVEIDESDGNVDSILDIREGAGWLIADDDLWVVEHDGQYLRRIDPADHRLGPSLSVPFGRPIAVSGSTAWSAVGESIRRWELPLDASPFVPPTRLEGDVVLMPVTLPDGRTVEIVHPKQLDLASLAVRAVSFAEPTQAPDCAAILYAYHGTDRFLHDEGIPEATYPSASGEPVELWEPPATVTYPEAWLVFSFGSWKVGVPVQGLCRDDDVLATWARSVTGRETPDGFLVLDAKPPVRSYEPGDPDAPGLIFEDDRFQVQVFSTACTPFDDGNVRRIGGKAVHRTEGVAQWCLSQDSILVRIEGEDALIDPLIRDIGIIDVSRA
jgi:streptogramin lyase